MALELARLWTRWILLMAPIIWGFKYFDLNFWSGLGFTCLLSLPFSVTRRSLPGPGRLRILSYFKLYSGFPLFVVTMCVSCSLVKITYPTTNVFVLYFFAVLLFLAFLVLLSPFFFMLMVIIPLWSFQMGFIREKKHFSAFFFRFGTTDQRDMDFLWLNNDQLLILLADEHCWYPYIYKMPERIRAFCFLPIIYSTILSFNSDLVLRRVAEKDWDWLKSFWREHMTQAACDPSEKQQCSLFTKYVPVYPSPVWSPDEDLVVFLYHKYCAKSFMEYSKKILSE